MRTAARHGLERGERKSGAVVEVPVFFRGDEGQMRLHEADREEEGLIFFGKLPDTLRCRAGHPAVVVGVIRNVAGFGRRAGGWLALLQGFGKPGFCRRILITSRRGLPAGSHFPGAVGH